LSAVIDASVLVAALVDSGQDGAWAESILAVDGLHAPTLVYAETANVLRRLESSRRISASEANQAFDDLMQLAVQSHPFEPFAERIWELRHNITAYDAWYVALAEALSLPLATLDAPLARTKSVRCKFLIGNT
jgi:predicted nucleic acid-binding protein